VLGIDPAAAGKLADEEKLRQLQDKAIKQALYGSDHNELIYRLADRPEDISKLQENIIAIDQFIQNSVLDEDPIDSLGRIREYRSQYMELWEFYNSLLDSRKQLEKVEAESQAYEDRLHFVTLRELLLDYQNYKAAVEEKENIQTRIRFLKEKLSAE
ncbi:MAG: hypothetical protein II133_00105, partial [Lachnospiraceae bacterium]|nr:hypothetical protein [Lachnospiraceae bacterium]